MKSEKELFENRLNKKLKDMGYLEKDKKENFWITLIVFSLMFFLLYIAVLLFSSISSSSFFPNSQEYYALCVCENFTFYGMFHNRDDCRNFCESSNLLKHPQRFIDLKILEVVRQHELYI